MLSIKSSLLALQFYIPLFILLSLNSYSNSKEDSLLLVLEQTRQDTNQLQTLMNMVNHTKSYDYKKSILYATQGIVAASNSGKEIWKAKFQFETAVIYYSLSLYDQSLEQYMQAMNVFIKYDSVPSLLKCYNNIGLIYDRIEKYDKAIEYYQLALTLYNNSNSNTKDSLVNFLPHHYNNIASAYNKLKQTEKAKAYYNMALEKAQNSNSKYILGSIFNNLGIIEFEKQNYALSKQLINKAISVRDTERFNSGLATSYILLSHVYFETNMLDSAVVMSQKALNLAQQHDLLETQKSAHHLLFKIYETNNKLDKALAQYRHYNQMKDSIYSYQRMNRLTQLEIAHEIKQVEIENQSKITSLKHRQSLLIIAFTALVIIAMLLLWLYRIRRKKLKLQYDKLKLEIETRNRELTTNVMQLVQKNQLINDVVKQLLTLKDEISYQQKQTLHKIILNLQSQSNKEVWKEFEFRFNKVHNDFYIQLLDEHPRLTSSEKRLCALLRLDMTSKEIAAITHQTLRGVEVARSRLRKSLGLTRKETSLSSYLEKF